MAIDKIIIAPSMLSANFACLKSELEKVEKGGAKWLHIDVMDGHFVPNITVGPVVVSKLRKVSRLFFDVHLMISNPEKYIEAFKDAGADLITFHIEAVKNPAALIKKVKALDIKAGISIKPKTKAEVLYPLLKMLDLVLVMTVEPGFGGQSFMSDMLPKVKALKSRINKYNPKCYLQVDGGINNETAIACVSNGANVLVAGNSVFRAKNPALAVRSLLTAASK